MRPFLSFLFSPVSLLPPRPHPTTTTTPSTPPPQWGYMSGTSLSHFNFARLSSRLCASGSAKRAATKQRSPVTEAYRDEWERERERGTTGVEGRLRRRGTGWGWGATNQYEEREREMSLEQDEWDGMKVTFTNHASRQRVCFTRGSCVLPALPLKERHQFTHPG